MMHVQATYRGDPEAMKKQIVPAVNAGIEVALKMWHRVFLLRHFKPGAAGRYGYKKRTKKYMIRKACKKGHQDPLVWSGTMKNMLTRRLAVTTTKTKTTGKARLKGPSYLRMRAKGNQPDIMSEVKATARDELAAMAKIIDRVSTRKLNNIRTKRTKRIA